MIEYFEVESIGNTLRGMVHVGTKRIPIVIVHGFFSSNKIGPYRFYFEIAEKLNSIGYTVFRVDLSAMGESDGDSDHIEFENHVADLNRVIQYVCDKCDTNKIHLIAHCVGCCTAIESTVISCNSIQTITLISPFMPSDKNYSVLLGEKNYKQLSMSNSFRRKTMICQKSYIDAGRTILDNDKIKMIYEKYPIVYISEYDEFSSLDDSINWAKNYKIPYNIIRNANHNYLDYQAREDFLEKLQKRFLRI